MMLNLGFVKEAPMVLKNLLSKTNHTGIETEISEKKSKRILEINNRLDNYTELVIKI